MGVPNPTHCFDCRMQRKYAFRNERTLYNRSCDRCKKSIIGMYSADVVFPVYCPECWWSDSWNAGDYAMDLNFNEPFFTQLERLNKKVPHISLAALMNDNCSYVSWVDECKNCYLIYSSSRCEDSSYSELLVDCKDCFDCTNVKNSQNCYFCLDVQNSYNIKFSRNLKDCMDCNFSFDLRNCNNCLLSFNLRHKQYCIRNVEYTPEQYEKEKAKILSDRQAFQKAWEEFISMVKYDAIHKYANLVKSEACEGDDLFACNNSFNSFDSSHMDSCNNVIYGDNIKDCIDCFAIVNNSEMCYEVFSATDGNSSQFSVGLWTGNYNLKYCNSCVSSKDSFGCVGLKHGNYCILNKQYTKDEYEKTVKRIVEHMRKTEYEIQDNNEYGEFFPVSLSPFGYNETIASEYYPLNKQEVLSRGWGWKEDLPTTSGRETLESEDVPEVIQKTRDDMIKHVLACKECKRNYKIIKQELEFYKRHGLPVPLICPECRHNERIKLRNPRKLWERDCMCGKTHEDGEKCSEKFKTTYAPNRPEKVYGEKSYQSAIY